MLFSILFSVSGIEIKIFKHKSENIAKIEEYVATHGHVIKTFVVDF